MSLLKTKSGTITKSFGNFFLQKSFFFFQFIVFGLHNFIFITFISSGGLKFFQLRDNFWVVDLKLFVLKLNQIMILESHIQSLNFLKEIFILWFGHRKFFL